LTLPAAVLLAVSLSMDSFAAALSRGTASARIGAGEAARIAAAFALFQFAAPLAGWALGVGFAEHLAAVDHWIAFALLAVLGVKLVRDGLKGHEAGAPARLSAMALAALAFATSIDASAAGISLSLLQIDIFAVALLIGGVTFAIAFAGALIGRLAAPALGRHAMVLGGLGLIGIGVKVLLDHGVLG
jgi:putative Mn2+ efflux pump MntP